MLLGNWWKMRRILRNKWILDFPHLYDILIICEHRCMCQSVCKQESCQCPDLGLNLILTQYMFWYFLSPENLRFHRYRKGFSCVWWTSFDFTPIACKHHGSAVFFLGSLVDIGDAMLRSNGLTVTAFGRSYGLQWSLKCGNISIIHHCSMFASFCLFRLNMVVWIATCCTTPLLYIDLVLLSLLSLCFLFHFTPWKIRGWNLKIHPELKRKEIWTIHRHDFGFKM